MSKANASAKNRRAFNGNTPPPTPNAFQPNSNNVNNNVQPQGFTLQQVIAVIDRRLLNLESFVKDSTENTQKHVHFESNVTSPPASSDNVDSSVTEILNEFSSRFDILAEEISNLKDIVLKLQSYTMDVNKTLLEERIHVFSDLGSCNPEDINNQVFDITNDPVSINSETQESKDL